MNVIIYGAGYVGCVTAGCLAKMGHHVTIVDVVPSKVETVQNGRSPILEPGLDDLIASGVSRGLLRAELAEKHGDGLRDAEIAIICIGTPSHPNGVIDTRALKRVLQSIAGGAQYRAKLLTVMVRSTALAPLLRQILSEIQPRQGVDKLRSVINPEFLRETTAIADFFNPPLLVAGGDDRAAVDHSLSLFEGIPGPRFKVSFETASMLKYCCNAFHALKIAFANEIDTLASLIGANGQEVMHLMVQDKVLNISPAYLRPGFAFGGSCLPKDLRALEALAQENHQPLPLLASVLPSNRLRVEQALETFLAQPARRYGFIGLTFKKGSDDLRDSPYVELAERLIGKGFDVKIYDPDLDPKRLVGANMAYVMERLPHLARILVGSPEDAYAGAEAIVICKRFPNLEELRALASEKAVFYDLDRMVRMSSPDDQRNFESHQHVNLAAHE